MTIIEEIYNNSYFCPECKGHVVPIIEKGETVCSQCGLVTNEKEIMMGVHGERRSFSAEDKNKNLRSGSPITSLLPSMSLTTTIDKKKIQSQDLKRAAKLDCHMSWETRNLLTAKTELKRLSFNLMLPQYISEDAFKIYKKASKANLLRGRSIRSMIAACLYYTCKKNHLPVTFKDIFSESAESPKLIKKSYNALIYDLKLKIEITSPIELIPRYVGELNLDVQIEKDVINILKSHLNNTSMRGVNPKGLCAGAIYLVAKLKQKKISQKQISQVIGTTEVSLRSRFQELRKSLHFLN